MHFTNNKRETFDFSFLITVFFTFLGFIYIFLITRNYAPGISQDSVSYFAAAKNILSGHGVTMQVGDGSYMLITHWPPFYPMVLAFTSFITGSDLMESSRILSAILFGLSFFMLNLIFTRCSLNVLTRILMNVFFFISSVAGEYLMTDSEPLFIFLLLLQCYLFICYLDTSKIVFLFFAGLTAGFYFITRYAGAGFIAGTVLFLFFQKDNLQTKLIHITVYLLLVLIVMVSWIWYAKLHSTNPTDRNLVFHLISLKHLKTFAGTILFWISPAYRFVLGPLIIILSIVFVLSKQIDVKKVFSVADSRMKYFVWLIAAYCLFLVISISLFDFSTTFNNRMMCPIYPLILVTFIPIAQQKNKKYILYLPVILMLISGAINFSRTSRDFYFNGSGFNGKEWIQSELISKLKEGNQKNIFTNGEYVIPFLMNKYEYVYPLPKMLSSNTTIKNPSFNEEMEVLKAKIKSGEGVIVYFDNVKRYYLPGRDFIEKEFAGLDFEEVNDGLIIR